MGRTGRPWPNGNPSCAASGKCAGRAMCWPPCWRIWPMKAGPSRRRTCAWASGAGRADAEASDSTHITISQRERRHHADSFRIEQHRARPHRGRVWRHPPGEQCAALEFDFAGDQEAGSGRPTRGRAGARRPGRAERTGDRQRRGYRRENAMTHTGAQRREEDGEASMEQRTLRSKQLRALLWYGAEGKCEICGENLPTSWHADHIIPWRVSRRTIVEEMQALCPRCNLCKGGKTPMPIELRQHQKEMRKLCEDIVNGIIPLPERILAHVVPGGGKQLLALILAVILKQAGLI